MVIFDFGHLHRSATSVAANDRAAWRAKSKADMIHKLNIVEEEADESLLWMEMLVESDLIKASRLSAFMGEATESSQWSSLPSKRSVVDGECH